MDKEFETVLRSIAYGTDLHTVWNDFVTLTATSIANVFDFQQEREDCAVEMMKKYKEKDKERFSQLFSLTAAALEKNPRQDFLGGIFMRLRLGSKSAGQYFTPYHIAELMAEMVIEEFSKVPYETVNDKAVA